MSVIGVTRISPGSSAAASSREWATLTMPSTTPRDAGRPWSTPSAISTGCGSSGWGRPTEISGNSNCCWWSSARRRVDGVRHRRCGGVRQERRQLAGGEEAHEVGVGEHTLGHHLFAEATERQLEAMRHIDQLRLGVLTAADGAVRLRQDPAQTTTQRGPLDGLGVQLPVAAGQQAGMHRRLHALDQRGRVIAPGRVTDAQLAIPAVSVVGEESLERCCEPRGRRQPPSGILDRRTLELARRVRVLRHQVDHRIQLLEHHGALHATGAGEEPDHLGLFSDGAGVGPGRHHVLDDGVQEARQGRGLDVHGHGVVEEPGPAGDLGPGGGAVGELPDGEPIELLVESIHHTGSVEAVAQQPRRVHHSPPQRQRREVLQLGHDPAADGLGRLVGTGTEHAGGQHHVARQVEEEVAVRRRGDLPVSGRCGRGHRPTSAGAGGRSRSPIR